MRHAEHAPMPQRVLIVEDEQHLAEGLRFNLEAEGFEADIADTGEGALERLLADDYLYTHSNGSVLNKAQEIAESMSGDVQWTDAKFADLKVRIFGDVAILTGQQTIQGTAKGYVPGPRRISDIFVKRSGRWQWVGGQATLEPTK